MKKLKIAISVVLIVITIIFVSPYIAQALKYNDLKDYGFGNTGDKIHFLNTDNSDAIIIESQGKFAMVDASVGMKDEWGAYKNQSQNVYNYLKKLMPNKIVLEFIIGTHSHNDHISGFKEILENDEITVKKAYLKRYNADYIDDYEKEYYQNQEVYDDMVHALSLKNIPLEQNLNQDFEIVLGNFSFKLFNTKESTIVTGENDNSLGILVQNSVHKIFLAGDLNNYSGDEEVVSKLVGEVDVLKVPHHGLGGSSSPKFLKNLSPSIAVFTASAINNEEVYSRIKAYCGSNTYITGELNGVVLSFGKYIEIEKNSCSFFK